MEEIADDITVAKEYFSGLFDSSANVTINIKPNDNRNVGYKIAPAVNISTKNELQFGLTASYLESHNIRYKISGNKIEINHRRSLNKFNEQLRGKLISKAERLEFICQSVVPLHEEPQEQTPENVIATIKGFGEINPQWAKSDRRKYTPEFLSSQIEDEFGIDAAGVEPVTAPEVNYAGSLPDQYYAGFIDNSSRMQISVSRSLEYRINHSASPQISIENKWAGGRFNVYLEDFFEDLGISYSSSGDFRHVNVTINGLNDIETIIETIGSNLYIQYPQAEFLFEQGIPAFRDGYHRTKQGLYELVSVFENFSTARVSANRKYTSEYFEELWGESLDSM